MVVDDIDAELDCSPKRESACFDKMSVLLCLGEIQADRTRNRRDEMCARLRAGRSEQRHVVATGDQALRQVEDDSLDAAIPHWWDGKPRWSYLGDPHRSSSAG